MAPATTTATMPVAPADNSTESTGTGESQEDMFAKLKDKFFNEINKIPCEWPWWPLTGLGRGGGESLGWDWLASFFGSQFGCFSPSPHYTWAGMNEPTEELCYMLCATGGKFNFKILPKDDDKS